MLRNAAGRLGENFQQRIYFGSPMIRTSPCLISEAKHHLYFQMVTPARALLRELDHCLSWLITG